MPTTRKNPRHARTGLRRSAPTIREPKGFTLLEVMVALAVMALVLVSVFRMSAQSVAMDQSARFNIAAPLLAQEKLAHLIASGQTPPFQDAGRFAEDFSGYAWQARVETVTATPESPEHLLDINRLEVTVTLENSALSYALRTYRTPGPGNGGGLGR